MFLAITVAICCINYICASLIDRENIVFVVSKRIEPPWRHDWHNSDNAPVFEPGRDSATLSRSLFECRAKINHPRNQVANKYQMSHI